MINIHTQDGWKHYCQITTILIRYGLDYLVSVLEQFVPFHLENYYPNINNVGFAATVNLLVLTL